MFYNFFKSPAIIKSGSGTIRHLDALLASAHLTFPTKILVTQQELFDLYQDELSSNAFSEIIIVKGGTIEESSMLSEKIINKDALVLAFGGGSVLDIVKYCASRSDVPYITIPSTLSNDAVYSCVARLTDKGKKVSYGVQPPIGIIVDFNIVRKSPKVLLMAGVADIVSNLSALKDWKLAHKNIGESINELAYMLSKESVMPLLNYSGEDAVFSDNFLYDLTNAIVTSGLAMIIAGNTRVSSGAEHLISHAIDEYFSERSTLHGLQVGWAHLLVESQCRHDIVGYNQIADYYNRIGVMDAIRANVKWSDGEFLGLIKYARTVRNRYTIFDVC